MLVYEADGFLAVEDVNIEELYRSLAATSLPAPDGSAFELQAALCLHKAGATQVCQVAFYCRALKRAVIFGGQDASASAELEAARALLEIIGFSLEPVQLNLSPALRQVVLRGIAGLLTPADASRQHAEKKVLLEAMETTLRYEALDSPAAQKARHVLNVEQRHSERASVLRKVLEEKLAGAEKTEGKHQQLAAQVRELTVRLERALALVGAERRQREQAEAIRMSAEKRIQELEDSLVGLETKTAANVKSQSKISQLNKRIKELQGELTRVQEQHDQEATEKLRLNAELTESRARAESHAELLVGAETALREAQTRNEQLQSELARIREQFNQETTKKSRLNAELTESKTRVESNAELLVRTETALREAQTRNEQLQADCARLRSSAAAMSQELQAAQLRIAAMEQVLAAVDSSTAAEETAAREAGQLRLQLEALQQRLTAAEIETSHDRALRAELEARAAAERARIGELEQALAASSGKTESKAAKGKAPARKSRDDADSPEAALAEALAALQHEHLAREVAETALDDAHRLIDALEKALKGSRDGLSAQAPLAIPDEPVVKALTAKLRMAETQLEQEASEGRKVAKSLAEAERRLAALDGQLQQSLSQTPLPPLGMAAASGSPSRRLPHELRPAPAPGALFRPDWDLNGLPCDSADQIVQAWESAFNVQLSLEGYPSQYCSAFLVVLKEGGQKRLYLLFNLKKTKHTLVCVPGKLPGDEAALKQLLDEGQKYLKRSGFEMAKMSAAEVSGTLGAYFRKTGG